MHIDILTKLKFAKLAFDGVISDIQTYLADSSVPLETRWGVYLKVESDLPVGDWIVHPPEFMESEDFFYEYAERRERIYFSTAIEDEDVAIDTLAKNGEEEFINRRNNLNKLKEWVLKNGKGSFIYDW